MGLQGILNVALRVRAQHSVCLITTTHKSELLIAIDYFFHLCLPESKNFGEKQCFRHLENNEY